MKALILGLTFIVSAAAVANDPRIFTGKYIVGADAGPECMRDIDTRAYVSVNGDVLSIQYYSEEAVLLEIVTKPGKSPSPGASHLTDQVAVHWPNKSTLYSKTRTTGMSFGQKVDYIREERVSRIGTKLKVTELSDGRVEEECVLTKK